MDMAISHMVNAAKDQGVDTIDSAFLDANNPMG
jgi:citrate lyase beta subunit